MGGGTGESGAGERRHGAEGGQRRGEVSTRRGAATGHEKEGPGGCSRLYRALEENMLSEWHHLMTRGVRLSAGSGSFGSGRAGTVGTASRSSACR